MSSLDENPSISVRPSSMHIDMLYGHTVSTIIDDHLYLSDMHTAVDQDILKLLNITHIVNASNGAIPNKFPESISYMNIDIEDDDESDIYSHFHSVYKFLSSSSGEGPKENGVPESTDANSSSVIETVEVRHIDESQQPTPSEDNGAESSIRTPAPSVDRELTPHNRYGSYDSTATATPPHAGFTWRTVGTPSSDASDFIMPGASLSGPITATQSISEEFNEENEENEARKEPEDDHVNVSEEGVQENQEQSRDEESHKQNNAMDDQQNTGEGIQEENAAKEEVAEDLTPQSQHTGFTATVSGTVRVLFHCRMGVSRSATLVIAYLMQSRGLSLREAFEFTKNKRPKISPSPNFAQSLMVFEKDLYPHLTDNSIGMFGLTGHRPSMVSSSSSLSPGSPVASPMHSLTRKPSSTLQKTPSGADDRIISKIDEHDDSPLDEDEKSSHCRCCVIQ